MCACICLCACVLVRVRACMRAFFLCVCVCSCLCLCLGLGLYFVHACVFVRERNFVCVHLFPILFSRCFPLFHGATVQRLVAVY